VADAQRNLAVAQLHTVLNDLQEKQSRLEARYDVLAASAPKTVVTAASKDLDDVPPEIANDPAYKLLKQVAVENARVHDRVAAVEAGLKASADRQSAFDKQTNATRTITTERKLVTDWLEQQVIPSDPAIKENAVLAEALRMVAVDWLEHEFDPDFDIPTQEAQLRIKMGQRLTKLKGASGLTSKRDAALEVDAAAKSNLSAGAAARPGLAGPEKNPFDAKRETESWLKWKMEQRYKVLKEQRATATA
jgi:hypothetical protein